MYKAPTNRDQSRVKTGPAAGKIIYELDKKNREEIIKHKEGLVIRKNSQIPFDSEKPDLTDIFVEIIDEEPKGFGV